jgi:Glycogen recognition site of AMP-activated protein kinase
VNLTTPSDMLQIAVHHTACNMASRCCGSDQMCSMGLQQLQRQQRKLEESAVQTVPLVWVGVAADVRLMGSFDGWSRGVALSSAADPGDSVFHRFEGTLHARRGTPPVGLPSRRCVLLPSPGCALGGILHQQVVCELAAMRRLVGCFKLVVMRAPCCTGEYTVKFLVDGQWRLAPHWPTRDDAAGTTNNVLQIE